MKQPTTTSATLPWFPFSGFSVGCCINREVLLPTWVQKITLLTFRLNAPVVIRAKVKVRKNVAIYSHALPRIHVIGGQRSMRIAPPSLPPHHSGPAAMDFQSLPSQLKRSSIGVIWMCKASFTNNSCPLPCSSTVVSSQWIGWWYSHAGSATADFSIIPLSRASQCSFSLVSILRLVSPM